MKSSHQIHQMLRRRMLPKVHKAKFLFYYILPLTWSLITNCIVFYTRHLSVLLLLDKKRVCRRQFYGVSWFVARLSVTLMCCVTNITKTPTEARIE